ncbi:MAG TPA: histidine phosphatase family protein [Mariprofundaceae bacterium]|nr:histidine phosphatase family protein [Mariprofundaceae bacterium]
MRVDLLRHGALEGGVRYRGTVDDPLTAEGRAAMEAVWAQLAGDVDRIIASPLSRCAGPARAWAEQAGVPLVIEPNLSEMRYGDWEGLSADEIRARFPGMLERWRANPEGMRIPGAETVAELEARIAAFWEGMRAEGEGGRLLVVAHSGSLRMLIAHVLGAPVVTTRRLAMPYACWSRITVRQGQASLVFHNHPAPPPGEGILV